MTPVAFDNCTTSVNDRASSTRPAASSIGLVTASTYRCNSSSSTSPYTCVLSCFFASASVTSATISPSREAVPPSSSPDRGASAAAPPCSPAAPACRRAPSPVPAAPRARAPWPAAARPRARTARARPAPRALRPACGRPAAATRTRPPSPTGSPLRCPSQCPHLLDIRQLPVVDVLLRLPHRRPVLGAVLHPHIPQRLGHLGAVHRVVTAQHPRTLRPGGGDHVVGLLHPESRQRPEQHADRELRVLAVAALPHRHLGHIPRCCRQQRPRVRRDTGEDLVGVDPQKPVVRSVSGKRPEAEHEVPLLHLVAPPRTARRVDRAAHASASRRVRDDLGLLRTRRGLANRPRIQGIRAVHRDQVIT